MRYIFSGDTLSLSDVAEYIDRFRRDREDIKSLYDQYKGKRDVGKSVPHTEGRPDNHCNTNLAKYIVDVATGYFMGIPPTYLYSDDRARECLSRIYDASDETAINYSIAEDMSICGMGYDLVYLDEDKDIKITALDPREVFTIRDDGIAHHTLMAVRCWERTRNHETVTVGELYEAGLTRTFELQGASVVIKTETPTPFRSVPVTEYPNTRQRQGDFAAARVNIDAYNLALSYASDDLESVANAYLVLSGMEKPDEEEKEMLHKDRVLGLPSDGSAAYITKNIDSSSMTAHKRTLKADVMQVCCVPDLDDECFSGNASGEALKYKLWGLNQLFGRKKNAFDKALFRRMKLICDGLRLTDNIALEDIEDMVAIKFTKNMPSDVTGTLDNAIKASSAGASQQTVREMLEPATGVTAEDEAARKAEDAAEGDYSDIATPKTEAKPKKTTKAKVTEDGGK